MTQTENPTTDGASPTDYHPFRPATEGVPDGRDPETLDEVPLVAVQRGRRRGAARTTVAARGHGWPHQAESVSATANEQFCAAIRAVKNAAALRGVDPDTHIGRMLVEPESREVVAVGITEADCPEGKPLALPSVRPDPEAVPETY
jgi:hypothetical protein